MSNQETIKNLIQNAENYLKTKKFLTFTIQEPDYDNALHCYKNAAHLLKIEKEWIKSAEYYCEVAKIYRIQKSYLQEAYEYLDAADLFKRGEQKYNYEFYYEKAINIFIERGDYYKASCLRKKLAEEEEEENPSNYGKIIQKYKEAITYYNFGKLADICYKKIAHYSVLVNNYREAIENLHKSFKIIDSDKLLKYGVDKYYLLCILCYICDDDISGAKKSLEKFHDTSPHFISSREAILCEKVIDAYEKFDSEILINAAKEYDNILRLYSVNLQLLTNIKRLITSDDDMLC